MTDPLLLASQRTKQMVGRTTDLRKIKQALYKTEPSGMTITAVYGPGGIGKSRFAEEILLEAGNATMLRRMGEEGVKPVFSPAWHKENGLPVLAPDPLDMNDLSLHGQLEFMRAVADHLSYEAARSHPQSQVPVFFNNFINAYNEVRKGHQRALSYAMQQAKVQAAERAFQTAYRSTAADYRILLVIDTFEKLAYYHTDWLLEKSNIKKEDLKFSTAYWLETQIQEGKLPNTLLVLLGRAGTVHPEGQQFLNRIENACATAPRKSTCTWRKPIELSHFDVQDTRAYFQQLRSDLETAAPGDPVNARLGKALDPLLKTPGRLETLNIYTGGLPVLLSLYGALLAEDLDVHDYLDHTPKQAREVLQAQGGMDRVQRDIASVFVDRLFTGYGLRAAIFNLLIATPRGLELNQLYLCVNGFPYDYERDVQIAEENRTGGGSYYSRADIEKEATRLSQLSIIKMRPDGRLALQDAIYESFADQVGQREASQKAEQDVRAIWYERLYDYATEQLETYQAERKMYLEAEEQELQRRVRSDMLPVVLQDPPQSRLEQLIENAQNVSKWEMEQLHYALLRNLIQAVNDVVFELSHRHYRANNEEADFRSLEEVYQVLYNDPLLKFLKLGDWSSLKAIEDPEKIEHLRRFMKQAEVTRWLQRFILRNQYDRALKLLEAVEGKNGLIDQMPEGEEKDSWWHSFSVGERHIWWAYLNTFVGNNKQAIETLNQHIHRLERLLEYPHSAKVPVEHGQSGKQCSENGFADHPARRRMIRVIALAYNILGYAYINNGQIDQAITSYTHAQNMHRVMAFGSEMPVTLNNLSRALSDKGRGRARRVCLDALSLNKKEWADIQVAYSYNTLALIDNDQYRPFEARDEAAMALAYFERAQDERGIGLACLQYGEALRRIALNAERTGAPAEHDPTRLLDTAESLLARAVAIFTQGQPYKEVIRRVEAFIETGCLLRDRMLIPDGDEPFHLPKFTLNDRHYAGACYYLRQAEDLAKEMEWTRLQLDARVNLAWTHFNMMRVQMAGQNQKKINNAEREGFRKAAEDYRKEVKASILAAMEIIPKGVKIEKNKPLPRQDAGEAYYFQQLSKLEGLQGRMEMEAFVAKVHQETAARSDPKKKAQKHELDFLQAGLNTYLEITNIPGIKEHLRLAIQAYTRALIYSDLFSPRSGPISLIYSAIYKYISGFNPVESYYAYQFAVEARDMYRLPWLQECNGSAMTGIYYLKEKQHLAEPGDLPEKVYLVEPASVSILSDLPRFIYESVGAFTQEDLKIVREAMGD